MDPKIIDGKKLAAQHGETLKKRVAELPKKPKVVSILIGDNKASILYSNLKQKKAAELGIEFELKKFLEDVNWDEVANEIDRINNDPSIDGVMIQLPLPGQFLNGHQTPELLDKIDPQKDVDGLTGKGLVPQAAVRGILAILDSEKVDLKNSQLVVVGAKGMVGSELIKTLQKNFDTSMYRSNIRGVDKDTDNPCEIEKEADVLITVVGKKNLITADCVKPGAIVVDVGGDTDFENVKEIVGRITPPKGGVGPMTVVSLMENAVELAQRN